MNAIEQLADVSRPRWDHNRILFEIADGDDRIPCSISRAAMQDLRQRRHFRPTDLLLCFVDARAQIEAIARGKLRARPGGLSGTLGIWTDDIETSAPGHRTAPTTADAGDIRGNADNAISTKKT